MIVEFPLDNDGFVRRECPHCLREFKLSPALARAPQYHCPYCGNTAYHQESYTQAQREAVSSLIAAEMRRRWGEELKKIARRLNHPRGIVRLKVRVVSQEAVNTLAEPNDMVRIVPPCHPEEALKILEVWKGPIHCPICGNRFDCQGRL